MFLQQYFVLDFPPGDMFSLSVCDVCAKHFQYFCWDKYGK